ncbi:MAG: YggS family pyridoxal phosphate-dependent enzyme [Deltaproteobacteria bacterium]|nr:YggS family pyridoxal phosphate-dependent enzyme [Deltaproteobacteria bacterium]
MSTIRENIEKIRENIAEAAVRAGRNVSDIRLMGVTKTVDDARIMEAIEAGIDIIGENYVQEGKRKIEKMGKTLEWHMIGHLQSNKSKYAIKLFDLIHSVDRMSLARELDKRSGNAGLKTKILVEVNVSGEETKSGVRKENALSLIKEIAGLRNLAVQGLMTMPPWFDNQEDARPFFVALRELRDRIIEEDLPDVVMKELSMGMSGDYRVAVEEGATIVRIGTAIFGERVY